LCDEGSSRLDSIEGHAPTLVDLYFKVISQSMLLGEGEEEMQAKDAVQAVF
jgi:hypothetical protein